MATRRDNAPKSFREAACGRCGQNFQPTGPNSKRCEPCKVDHKREYEREKKRASKVRLAACLDCGGTFPLDIHAHQRRCDECAAVHRRKSANQRYHATPDGHRAVAMRHYNRNKDAILASRKKPEERKKIAARERRRRAGDPSHRLHCNISRVISMSLNGKKAGASWESLVGYPLAELKRHLERQFLKGMAWDNYGSVWHVDHITPRVEFNFDSAAHSDFKACWALSNLRPLWSLANISKGPKRTHLL